MVGYVLALCTLKAPHFNLVAEPVELTQVDIETMLTLEFFRTVRTEEPHLFHVPNDFEDNLLIILGD